MGGHKVNHATPPFPPFSTEKRAGLVYLRDRVADYFSDVGLPVTVAPVGLKYRAFTLNQDPALGGNRIVFIPGKFEGDVVPKLRDYGAISRQTSNSAFVRNPQEIGSFEKLFTVSIWAPQPVGTSGNEQAAGEVAEDLLEQVFRAMVMSPDPSGVSMAASLVFGAISINSPPNDNSFGCELLWQVSQIGPLFGPTLEVVQASPAQITPNEVNFT